MGDEGSEICIWIVCRWCEFAIWTDRLSMFGFTRQYSEKFCLKARYKPWKHCSSATDKDGGSHDFAEVNWDLVTDYLQQIRIESPHETYLKQRIQNYFCYTAFVNIPTFKQNLCSAFSYPTRDEKSSPSGTYILRRRRIDWHF